MPNRLAAETSPYLRQHADNPVDWFPWGNEALAKARSEQKPIFLSIGYATCHWCHVMARESFEQAGVAEVLNREFVAIKVDREERPDLDRVYMTYVQQTTGHGGWPMSVWLTPEGKPFYGGTYFAPEERQGRPGLVAVLEAIARHWRDDRPKIETGAEEVVQALQRYAREGAPREAGPGPGATAPLHEAAGDAFEKGYQYFFEAHDEQWGGFGGAPKFPRASVITFLFRLAALQGAKSELGESAIKLAAHTLQKMAEGGIHDHVGGGFHRYAVDETWAVPHFEKMLYDQAQLAVNYLDARQATGREVFGWVARDILDYVGNDLTGPDGEFYSAEDADSKIESEGTAHAEGAFYVWTRAEFEAALGPDAPLLIAHFGVQAEGNVPADPAGEFSGKNILRQRQSLVVTARAFQLEVEAASGQLLRGLATLRTLRASRPRPLRDDKVITAWNGLMISAYAKAHQQLSGAGETDYLRAATRAAEFLRQELADPATGDLYRSWRQTRGAVPGFAEDYAYLIQGLLDLYEVGFEIRWLQWAIRLQTRMDELFWDAEGGGYYASRADDPTVVVRLKEDYDGAEPAPSSIAVLNLMRLDWMLGLPGARDRALQTIDHLRPQWSRVPQALPQFLSAFELALTEPRTAILVGDPSAREFQALTHVLAGQFGLRRVCVALDARPDADERRAWLLANRPAWQEMMKAHRGGATVYLCDGNTCAAPVATPEALAALLGALPSG